MPIYSRKVCVRRQAWLVVGSNKHQTAQSSKLIPHEKYEFFICMNDAFKATFSTLIIFFRHVKVTFWCHSWGQVETGDEDHQNAFEHFQSCATCYISGNGQLVTSHPERSKEQRGIRAMIKTREIPINSPSSHGHCWDVGEKKKEKKRWSSCSCSYKICLGKCDPHP